MERSQTSAKADQFAFVVRQLLATTRPLSDGITERSTGRFWPGLLSGPYEFIATKRPINSRDPETKLGKSALLTRCSCGILTCEYVQLKT